MLRLSLNLEQPGGHSLWASPPRGLSSPGLLAGAVGVGPAEVAQEVLPRQAAGPLRSFPPSLHRPLLGGCSPAPLALGLGSRGRGAEWGVSGAGASLPVPPARRHWGQWLLRGCFCGHGLSFQVGTSGLRRIELLCGCTDSRPRPRALFKLCVRALCSWPRRGEGRGWGAEGIPRRTPNTRSCGSGGRSKALAAGSCRAAPSGGHSPGLVHGSSALLPRCPQGRLY